MAQSLKRLLCLLLCWQSSAVLAQSLRDPTQPPRGYFVAGSAAGALPEPGEGEERPPRSLQTIVRPHHARPHAVIDGRIVRLGERIDEARLVRIRETEVVLLGPNGRETLAMTPAVSKIW